MKINDAILNTGFKIDKNDLQVGKWNLLDGPSGSGKTTLLKQLSRTLKKRDSYKISYIPQRPVILPEKFVDNIAFFREIDEGRLETLMSILKLKPSFFDLTLKDNGFPLSGGELQKMFLARALIKEVDILIMDESFSAIDEATSDSLINEIKKQPITVIYTAHGASIKQYADNFLTLIKC